MTSSSRLRKRAARKTSIPAPTQLLRQYFLGGLLVVLPISVIAWILLSALGVLWQMQDALPEVVQPSTWVDDGTLVLLLRTLLMGAQVVLLGLGISLVGWLSKQFLGRKLLELIAILIARIPVLRSIYSALDQLFRTFASGGGSKQFNRVVYVEYPRAGSWALAFVTGPARSPIEGTAKFLNLYVPTTPNPTSGFHLILPETEVRDSGLSVEEAFKTILSLGIVQSHGR